jgi:hypothetical protein
MLGIVQRAATKFDAVGETLAIGEGIESVLAARQLGFAPAWALGSVGAISFFPLTDGVKQLVILGEAGDASARAIKSCGTRWRKAGRRVRNKAWPGATLPHQGSHPANRLDCRVGTTEVWQELLDFRLGNARRAGPTLSWSAC